MFEPGDSCLTELCDGMLEDLEALDLLWCEKCGNAFDPEDGEPMIEVRHTVIPK